MLNFVNSCPISCLTVEIDRKEAVNKMDFSGFPKSSRENLEAALEKSNQLLRRDEIWFTEKDKKGIASVYSLADFVDEDGIRINHFISWSYVAHPVYQVADHCGFGQWSYEKR